MTIRYANKIDNPAEKIADVASTQNDILAISKKASWTVLRHFFVENSYTSAQARDYRITKPLISINVSSVAHLLLMHNYH